MNNAFVIGMTGPTGSGKSTVGKLLLEKGFKIVDADKVARRVTEKGSPTLAVLCSAFGDDILLENGELDRALLAKRAFADKESLEKLNSITHPAIIELIRQEIEALKTSGETKIVLDAPQLFEAGAQSLCDFILSVLADKETRLERIKNRDNITDEQALSRINAQKSDEFFVENSDLVIYNNSDTEALIPQIDLLSQKLEVRRVGTDSVAQTKNENQAYSPKKKIAIFATIAACVVALIVGIILVVTGRGYTKVLDKTLDIYKNPTVENIKAVFPKQTWDFLVSVRYASVDENVKTAEDIIRTYTLPEAERFSKKVDKDFGENWSFEYDIILAQKLSDEVCNQIEADLGKSAVGKIKVKKAYRVNLSYKINGTKTKEGFMDFVAIKIDGEWYTAEQLADGWKIAMLDFQ